MSAIPKLKFSVEEYLALDEDAERKCDYHDGELFPVIDATIEHSTIELNVAGILYSRLRKTGCRALPAIRTCVTSTKYIYPDLAVVCGELKLTDEKADTLMNPTVIIEILSPSTTDYDHGGKFELYRMLPSFEEYLLISQDKPHVEIFRKQSPTDWSLRIATGIEMPIRIQSLGIEFPLGDIYEGISF